jgi:Protein of unknown function (DUF4232)
MSKTSVTILTATLAAAAAVTLAGCGTSSAAGHSATSAPATSAPATTASNPAVASATASAPAAGGRGGSSAAGAPAECRASQLTIAYTSNAQIRNGALAGMSHADQVVTFTNAGSAACDIQGYPGVAALDSAGTQIRQAARGSGTIRPVTLAAGATASALISANTASCSKPSPVAGLLVTAPDQRTSTRLGPAGTFCPASLSVGPVAAGNAAGLQL